MSVTDHGDTDCNICFEPLESRPIARQKQPHFITGGAALFRSHSTTCCQGWCGQGLVGRLTGAKWSRVFILPQRLPFRATARLPTVHDAGILLPLLPCVSGCPVLAIALQEVGTDRWRQVCRLADARPNEKRCHGAIASMDIYVRHRAKSWLCSLGMALCPSCRCCMQARMKHVHDLMSSSSQLARWTSTPTAAN